MINFFKKIKSFTVFITTIIVVSFFNVSIAQATQLITYTPAETTKVLNNPLMGWTPDGRWTSTNQPHKLVYAEIKWREIEPKKGFYDFSAFETKYNFSYWHQHDVKVIFRVVLDKPTSEAHKDIPDWLYNEINGDGTWYNNSYGLGFSPNYENSKLISYHQKLISALGQRYNNSGDIAFIELGSLGHWGEWHTMQDSDSTFIPFPREAIANQYVNHYIKSFPNKKLLMRRPFNAAKTNNFGLFNDMIGSSSQTSRFISWINNGYYNNYTKMQQPSMSNFWKVAPSGGEFANGNAGLQYLTSTNFNNTLSQAKQSHVTFVGPNCPAIKPLGGSNQKNMDAFLTTIGYRFIVSKTQYLPTIKPAQTARITITINNKGVAPFYYNWPAALTLVSSDGRKINTHPIKQDIRKWLPGITTFTANLYIPSKTIPGVYKIGIGITDPLTGKPSIDFANEGKMPSGYFYIGNITVSK